MNSYGNFVVQNALKFASLEDRNKLSEQIEKNIPNISDAKIKQKWSQLLKKNTKTSLADIKGNHYNIQNIGVFKSQDSQDSSSSQGKKNQHSSDYQGGRKSHGKSQMNPGNMMPPPPNRSQFAQQMSLPQQ